MSLHSSPELFLNIKSVPDRSSSEYEAFFQNELDKIRYGITINGVYIHGWLYWHLNHWKIYLDVLDKQDSSQIIRSFQRPDFRDNEWLIAENIKKAEDLKKGLLIFGTRRFGKSDFEASWIGRGATIFDGSENVLSSTNEADIKILASKVDKGLNALHPYLRFDRLNDDFRKEISLGIKEKRQGGKKIEWSKILIRNLDGGKNTEAIAGTTPKTLVIDEIGKSKMLEAFEAAKPGFTSPFGWRCVPILTGTGGLFDPNSDAEKMFKDPESYNFLAVEIPGKVKKYGVFVPGTYRMEAKTKTTFGDFIQRQSGIIVPADSELNTLEFFQSDHKRAAELIAEELAQLEKASDPKAALKMRMYYPEDPDDCFLSPEKNKFPVDAIKQHLSYLEELEKQQGFVGQAVELYRDIEGRVKWTSNTRLKPILDWPVNAGTIKDAPVIMYEPPMDSPSPFLYIAGGDPYNVNDSTESPSLGTVYIYKRLYNVVDGSFQNMIVASYSARPALMKEWHQTVELLLELYNAQCMIENAGTNFIDYMSGKNKGYYLAEGYNIVLDVSPNTSIKRSRSIGLPPTPRVISHCMNLLYDYCNEELTTVDDQGKVHTRLGVSRIMDRMLLIEMLNYNPEQNVDRIVAFRHALAYDAYLQKVAPVVRHRQDEGPMIQTSKPPARSPFPTGLQGPFRGFGKSPF